MKKCSLLVLSLLILLQVACTNNEVTPEVIEDDGILYEEGGLLYGYGEDADVYSPDIKEDLEVVYETDSCEWASGIFRVNGLPYTADSDLVTELIDAGYEEVIDNNFIHLERDDKVISIILGDNDEIVSITDEHASCGLVDGIDASATRESIIKALGTPIVEVKYTSTSNAIAYRDASNKYYVEFLFDDDTFVQCTYNYLIQDEPLPLEDDVTDL